MFDMNIPTVMLHNTLQSVILLETLISECNNRSYTILNVLIICSYSLKGDVNVQMSL